MGLAGLALESVRWRSSNERAEREFLQREIEEPAKRELWKRNPAWTKEQLDKAWTNEGNSPAPPGITIEIGMSEDEVRQVAGGPPDRINTTLAPAGQDQQWVYDAVWREREPLLFKGNVYVRNGRVYAIQKHE